MTMTFININYKFLIDSLLKMTYISSSHASFIDFLPVITPINTGFGKDLPNLAEIYIDEVIYNNKNNAFILELANLLKNTLNKLLKNFQRSRTSRCDSF